MKALIYEGPGKMSYTEDLEVRDPEQGEVLVRIVASGICHSDISVLSGAIPWPAPAVLGHEGAGVIEKVGPGVTKLQPGDHVALHTLANCGQCAYCSQGRPTHCRSTLGNRAQPFTLYGQPIANFAATSTFVEKTVVKQQQAVKIDAGVPLDRACLVGCGVMTGVGTVLNRAKVDAGDTAVVFGVGGVGLNVIQGLRIAGASRIVAIDLLASREAGARQMGATDFVDASQVDAVEAVKAIFADPVNAMASGVKWAFECSGSPRALGNAIACLGWGGSCVIVGTPGGDQKVDLPIMAMTQVDRSIIGARYGSSQPHKDVETYLALYAGGKLMLDELISQRYTLDQYEEAFHDLESGKLARGVFVF
jgi:S-(hydroxymethyl)glutathione dehydrogenase/alcohol dehydrogenase